MQKVDHPVIGEEEQVMLLRSKWLYSIALPLSAPLSLYWSVAWGDDIPGVFVAIIIMMFMIAAEHATRVQFGAPLGAMVGSALGRMASFNIVYISILVFANKTGMISQ
jgi:hypothetical protein